VRDSNAEKVFCKVPFFFQAKTERQNKGKKQGGNIRLVAHRLVVAYLLLRYHPFD
jgi:hypothetical protein